MRKFHFFVLLLVTANFHSIAVAQLVGYHPMADSSDDTIPTLTTECKDAIANLQQAKEIASNSKIDPECQKAIQDVGNTCTRPLDLSEDEVNQASEIATQGKTADGIDGSWSANAFIFKRKQQKYIDRSRDCSKSEQVLRDKCREAENRIHAKASPDDGFFSTSHSDMAAIWNAASPVLDGADITAKCDKSRAAIEGVNADHAEIEAQRTSSGAPAPVGQGSEAPDPHKFDGDYGSGVAVDENGKSLIDKQEEALKNKVEEYTGSSTLGYAAAAAIKGVDMVSPATGAALSAANGDYSNAVTSGATAVGEATGLSVMGTIGAAASGALIGATGDRDVMGFDDSPGINSFKPTSGSTYAPPKAVDTAILTIQPTWQGS
jgi:hypothetical protein